MTSSVSNCFYVTLYGILLHTGQSVFLFSDEDIQREIEDHHIRKLHDKMISVIGQDDDMNLESSQPAAGVSCIDNDFVMNAEITDNEVKSTFCKGSDTAGPDGVSASMIDKADRELMHGCLKLLWNKAWLSGKFIKIWKEENRIVIPKLGKEDYHDCSSYRTISVTSCLGKRFEYITCHRLKSILVQKNFDINQYAYLKSRSSTHAVLTVSEIIKKGLVNGQLAGAVFFDLCDAFGSVNRNRLLNKIKYDFHISGCLLCHIASFLRDRTARIKFEDRIGDWLDSLYGTSAGTRLGPMLFIMHLHDIPKCIKPKFADDLVAICVDNDFHSIQDSLQEATSQLVQWADNEGMSINAAKTKVMVFGNQVHSLSIKIKNTEIENVMSFKYLGILLDPMLDFGMQVDYAVGKAKRAMAKVCTLINGREGIGVQIGINLYKALVRPHLEYAIPAWANISDLSLIHI